MKIDYKLFDEKYGKDVGQAIRELYSLYTPDLYRWIAGLWSGECGGFYYSNSARDNSEFLPDLESTSQALGHLDMIGITDSDYSNLPKKMKEKLYGFVTSMQDSSDGYFYHPQWGKSINTSRRGRDSDHAITILDIIGMKPLYPTVNERLAGENKSEETLSAAPHLASKEAFLAYLEGLDILGDSYSKGHILSAEVSQIKAAGLADVCVDYLNSIQFKETGLWAKEPSYLSLSGLLKITGTYKGLGMDFPNMKNALRSAIEIAMSKEPAPCTVLVYNPICSVQNLFEIAKSSGDEALTEEARKILKENASALIRRTAEKLSVFRKGDGAFSYNADKSTGISQKVPVSLGLSESDMNATALCDSSRVRCLKIIGINETTLFDCEDRKEFFSIIGEN